MSDASEVLEKEIFTAGESVSATPDKNITVEEPIKGLPNVKL